MKLICIVEDVFQITSIGCVIAPGVPRDFDLRVRTGDGILLRRPDGSQITTTVRSIPMGGRAPGIPLNLHTVHKDDVPIGTEVWLV